jgi:hypothetical protein
MNTFKNGWFIGLILFLGGFISLVISSAYPFVIASLFAMVLNNVSCIAIILITPIVEGFLNLNLETPIPVETLIMSLLSPIILWNCILKAPVLYKRVVRIYTAFCVIIILGTYVVLVQRFYLIKSDEILQDNLIILCRILFCILLSYFFVSLKSKGVLEGFKIVQQLAPWLILLTTVYYLANGTQKGQNTIYLVIGNIKHGEFSAVMVAFSLYVFYNIYTEKSWVKKLLNIISVISMGYLIFQLGSKNGLLSLMLVIIFSSYYFFIKGKPLRFLVISALLFGTVYFVLNSAANTPTMQRLLAAETSQGINVNTLTTNRYGLWVAGVHAFFSLQGIIGYGSSPLASRWITGTSPDANKENVLHNTPLEFAIQFGILGLALYGYLVFTITKYFLLFWKTVKKQRIITPLLIPFLCFFSVAISGMFLSWQWQSYWWYQIALIFAIVKLFFVQNKI